jgi:cytochrome c5
MRRIVPSGLVAGLLASFLAALAPAVARAQPANALPPGDGRDIVAAACTQCHALTVILAMRDGPVGWKRHVYNMVMRGAQLTPRDADTVLGYLNANFGPGQRLPAAKPVALPDGPGKELVETRCTLCHDLERVTAARRDKAEWQSVVANMFDRFGVSAPDDVRAISAYLAAHYGLDQGASK